jgi:hypothetical protein
MAALAADRNTEYSLGDTLALPVKASTTIYAGSLVCIDATGYAVPAADTVGLIFVGVATAQADNASGAAGDINVVVRRRGRYLLTYDGTATQADVGSLVYAVNDQTVDLTADTTNDILIGIVAKMEDADELWIEIDTAVQGG